MNCHKCEKNFINLEYHIQQVHNPVYYPCPHCVKSLNSKYTLKDHIKRMHCEERKLKEVEDIEKRKEYHFVCDECGKRFKLLCQLKQHIQGMHSENYYQCDECVEKFTWRKCYLRHIKLKHGPFVFKRRCGKGRKLLKYVKENNIPLNALKEEDRENIALYREYLEKHKRKYTE